MSRAPRLAELLEAAAEAREAGLRVGMFAQVVKYEKSTQRVDAQPCIMEAHEDESGRRVVQRLPVITRAPVLFTAGGGFAVTVPIAKGDFVWLAFSDQSLDKWLARGGVGVDPIDDLRHALSDAVAYPGGRPFSSPLEGASDDHMVLGAPSMAIHVYQDEIRIGTDDTGDLEPAVKGQTLYDYLVGLANFLQTAGGSDFFPLGAPSPDDFRSTTVKIRK